MTSITLSCKAEENKGVNFEIRFGQDENPTVEEKAAAVFLLPYVKEALERGLNDAEKGAKAKQEEQKIQKTIDGGPSIITLD